MSFISNSIDCWLNESFQHSEQMLRLLITSEAITGWAAAFVYAADAAVIAQRAG